MPGQKEGVIYASSQASSELDRTTAAQSQIDAEKQDGIDHSTLTDVNIVDWDGPDDPQNPMQWSTKAKVSNCSTIIFLTLLTPLASSMFAPGVPDVLREFKSSSDTLAAFVVSVFLLGFAVGPLLISPLSEMYGRRPIYIVCNVMFVVFTIACAVANSMAQLIVFRFFAGCFGVCPVTLGGASISDLIHQEKRGGAMSLYALGPLLGPVIGPVAGAYLASAEGWRWYVTSGLCAGSSPILDRTDHSNRQGLLADSHRLWYRHNPTRPPLQGDVRPHHTRQEDKATSERNRQRRSSFKTGRWTV